MFSDPQPVYVNPLLFKQPLNFQGDADIFPMLALPEKIRFAIFEVWQETQAPLPLVVTSALSALSVACQHLFDASRPNGMTSPCSLFFITIADSGERKTSSDKFFTRPIRDFEKKHLEENRKQQAEYATSLDIWKAKELGYKRNIQRLVSKNENCEAAELQLRQHRENPPEKPLVMRMLFDDVSPTAIISSLHDQWPSAGILSDEAGKLFNSKTFDNIGLYNKLWDGDSISLDRHRTTDSYTVTNGRLTVSLMSQQQTFRDFLEKQGNLARDNGFLARCLTCWPNSTQGYRQIEADAASDQSKPRPALDEFHRVINLLLSQAWQRHQLSQPRRTVTMSSDAARAWNHYYNRIEGSIGPMGVWVDVRDGASKAAENIARLACLFQAFESIESPEGWKISEGMVHAADVICMWYMNHFKSIFGQQSALSADTQNANELIAWLERTWAQRNYFAIPKNEARQLGPNKIRNKDKLEMALNILQKQGRIIVVQYGGHPGKKPVWYVHKVDNTQSAQSFY